MHLVYSIVKVRDHGRTWQPRLGLAPMTAGLDEAHEAINSRLDSARRAQIGAGALGRRSGARREPPLVGR
jgi:hypothetical protein